jgi:hypothetical protein
MPKYSITLTSTYKEFYQIKAKSLDEAMDKALSGEHEPAYTDEDGPEVQSAYEIKI